MGNIDSWKGTILNIEARAESIRDTVGELSQLVDALKEVTSSHERLLKVINDARDDWENCLEWMMMERDRGGRFVATDVARRAISVLENILATKSIGGDLVKSEWPSVISDEEEVCAEKAERDELLESHIIKLMSMTGTERDGSGAHWTSENIEYGLSRIGGGRTMDEIQKAIFDLQSRGIVRFVLRAGDEEVGYKDFYVLADGCAEPQKVQSLREKIIEALSSAMDEDGVLTTWTENQLFYAIKRTSAALSRKKVSAEIEKLEKDGEIDVLRNGEKRIIALGKDSIEKMREHLSALGMLYESAKEEEATAAVECNEKMQEQEKQGALEPRHALSSGTGAGTGLGENILAYMRGQPERLWRDYDISGHFRSMSISSEMFDEDGSDGPMKKELDLLVGKGLVEFIPRSKNPGQWEDRWKITKAGMRCNTKSQGDTR